MPRRASDSAKLSELADIESQLDNLERRATAIDESELAYVIELARVAAMGAQASVREKLGHAGRDPANDR